jgi:cell wall-associated NlpC family hydrolase
LIGVQLPRDASQQVQVGEPVDFIHEAQLGDLAFFHNEEGRIVHVGMMLNDHEIIHASGYVRVDRVDENGIFNADLQRYTHSLRVVKRIVC